MYADIIYGSYYRFSKDDDDAVTFIRDGIEASDDTDLNDMFDTLSEKYDAKVVYSHNGERTVWFGHQVMTLNENSNDFEERSLLATMNLEKANLREDIRKSVVEAIEKVPYNLRDRFSAPGYHTIWGAE